MFKSGGAGVTGSTPEVSAAALQADGKFLIGGAFTRYNSMDCRGVAAITVQPDGRILIGGDFTTYNGYSRCGIARIWD